MPFLGVTISSMEYMIAHITWISQQSCLFILALWHHMANDLNFDSDKGLVPEVIKPLPDAMFIYDQRYLWYAPADL